MSADKKAPTRGQRREIADPRQQDLFASFPEAPKPISSATFGGASDAETRKPRPPAALPPPRMKLVRSRATASVARTKVTSPSAQAAPPVFGVDDWWTTRTVCTFLKIGRKALWNMRRNPSSDFPEPVDAVGHRHLYRAVEVRAWMEAQREHARRRATERRQALTQFSSSPST